eukprot:EG_transcript_3735
MHAGACTVKSRLPCPSDVQVKSPISGDSGFDSSGPEEQDEVLGRPASGPMVEAWHVLGLEHLRKGETQEAVDCLLEAVRLSEEDGDGDMPAIYLLNDLGSAYLAAGNFRMAFQSHCRAWQLCAEVDSAVCAASLGGMGLSYCRMGEYDTALEVYQQMLEVVTGWDDPKAVDHTLAAYLGLGCVHMATEQHASALAAYDSAFVFAVELEDPVVEIRVSLFLGNVHFSLQSPEKAWEHYERALRLAREHQEPRHQLRAYCGELHCCYDEANHQDAAKLLKMALAVPQSGGPALPSPFDQLLDEQLLQMLHWTLAHHATEAPRSELLSTLYVYLWGLATVLLRHVGVLAPTSLPTGFLDTVRAALSDACHPGLVPGQCHTHRPYVQHYTLAVLHHACGQKALRAALHVASTADAILACLAAEPVVSSGGVDVHTAAVKLLKALLGSLPPGPHRQALAALFWHSGTLPALHAVLQRQSEPSDETHEQHVLHVLTALCTVLEAGRPPNPADGSGATLQPANAAEVMPTFQAVVEAVKGRIDRAGGSDLPGQALSLGCRFLLHCSRRLPGCKAMLRRRLDPAQLERLSGGHTPTTRAPSALVVDGGRGLRRPAGDEPSRVVDFRSIPGGTGPWTDESTSADDSTAMDSLDSTVFDSVSSHSSFAATADHYVVSVQPLPLVLEDFDSELVPGSSADGGSAAPCDSDRLTSIG